MVEQGLRGLLSKAWCMGSGFWIWSHAAAVPVPCLRGAEWLLWGL